MQNIYILCVGIYVCVCIYVCIICMYVYLKALRLLSFPPHLRTVKWVFECRREMEKRKKNKKKKKKISRNSWIMWVYMWYRFLFFFYFLVFSYENIYVCAAMDFQVRFNVILCVCVTEFAWTSVCADGGWSEERKKILEYIYKKENGEEMSEREWGWANLISYIFFFFFLYQWDDYSLYLWLLSLLFLSLWYALLSINIIIIYIFFNFI